MHKISVLAFPYDTDCLSLGALKALREAECIVLKQKASNFESFLQEEKLNYISLDELWESSNSYEELYATLKDKVLDFAKSKKMLFCVPDPLFDSTVKLLAVQTELEIIPSLSLSQYYMAKLPFHVEGDLLTVPASDL